MGRPGKVRKKEERKGKKRKGRERRGKCFSCWHLQDEGKGRKGGKWKGEGKICAVNKSSYVGKGMKGEVRKAMEGYICAAGISAMEVQA